MAVTNFVINFFLYDRKKYLFENKKSLRGQGKLSAQTVKIIRGEILRRDYESASRLGRLSTSLPATYTAMGSDSTKEQTDHRAAEIMSARAESR